MIRQKKSFAQLLAILLMIAMIFGTGMPILANDENTDVTEESSIETETTSDGEVSEPEPEVNLGDAIAAASFSGGTGLSEDDPFLISNQADLEMLRTQVNAGTSFAGYYFALTNDITLTGTWTPIGTASTRGGLVTYSQYPYVYNGSPFSGTFNGCYDSDGDGEVEYYSITEVRTNPSSSDRNPYGLFGYISGATIKNLSVVTAAEGVKGPNNGYGTNYVGGLVGYADNSKIEKCSISGKVSGGNTYPSYYTAGTGGLVGSAEYTTITDCHAIDIEVTATQHLTGNYNVGGLLGLALSGTSVNESTAQGTVTAQGHYVGGLIGHIYLYTYYYPDVSAGVTVSKSHADVAVTNSNSSSNETGGLIGKIAIGEPEDSKVTIKDCTAKGDVTGKDGSSAYYGGLIGEAYNYTNRDSLITIENCHATGNVTTVYYNVGGLVAFAHGNVTIKNCTAKGNVTATATGAVDVGGLIGYAHRNITVENCSATGNVTSKGSAAINIGGLIGLADGVSHQQPGVIVKNSFATGDVYGGSYEVGGFIGDIQGQTSIENCFAAGNVKSDYSGADSYFGVGGFIGVACYGGITVKNSYSLGRVESNGNQPKGSFVGNVYYTTIPGAYNNGSNNYLLLENCYASGTVEGTRGGSGRTGGFIGRVADASRVTIVNSYFDKTMTGTSTAVGRDTSSRVTGTATGLTTEEMIAGRAGNVASGKYINFDYQNKRSSAGNEGSPWYIDERATYPYLFYQYDGQTREDTNYNIKIAKWNNSVEIVDRTDFSNISGTGQFTVASNGADQMYFPYADGRNVFADNSDTISVPNSSFSAGSYSLYSLGSVSKTNIVAFSNMPGAEKNSDREDLDGDGVTDTYPGDRVNYTITVTNNIPVYTDRDDMTKETYDRLYTWRDVVVSDPLVDHVRFVADSVQISQDGGASWTAAMQGAGENQFTYDNTAGDNGTLYVYLPDMEPEREIQITFQVIVQKEAIGNSIRNKGSVEGGLSYQDETTKEIVDYEYVASFDDRNDDPVKGPDDETSVEFTFRKVDMSDTNMWLPGATFALYQPKDAGNIPQGVLASDDADNPWERVVINGTPLEVTSQSPDGIVDFGSLSAGTYMLVETTSPLGYELPGGQWEITLSLEEGEDPISIVAYAADGVLPPAFIVQDEELYLPNISQFHLPTSGDGGIFPYIITGIVIIGTALFILYLILNEKKIKKRFSKF